METNDLNIINYKKYNYKFDFEITLDLIFLFVDFIFLVGTELIFFSLYG